VYPFEETPNQSKATPDLASSSYRRSILRSPDFWRNCSKLFIGEIGLEMGFLVTTLIFVVVGIIASLCIRICCNRGPSAN
ncbi:Hypothetical predicted protein, partial [Olea europaea subsp. europaea]